ncbi:MAG TPA: 16S rRNA (cytosine(1402)-N(4))-methyltransferase, partial [Syntrophomonas sp.]|nr:16S rRNA (cytosine(1402)-N(4))-methyltransferase [Syntrophomonas sp.]
MHLPVLLEETITNLITDPQGIYVDCTVGGGGHLRLLASRLEADATIIGLDKDAGVLNKTRESFSPSEIKFVQSDFRYLSQRLEEQGISAVDGIMIDLGVSSFQLDDAARGFSFHEDARLDMRMDQSQALDAWQIVNEFEEEEISRIIFKYGEEKFARRIARAIIMQRKDKSIDTTLELVDIIKTAVPARYQREKHPARRTFQALRIRVNGELEALEAVLPQAFQALKPGGRLCIITFHSLEDRIVKHFMADKARGCICPPELPVCV